MFPRPALLLLAACPSVPPPDPDPCPLGHTPTEELVRSSFVDEVVVGADVAVPVEAVVVDVVPTGAEGARVLPPDDPGRADAGVSADLDGVPVVVATVAWCGGTPVVDSASVLRGDGPPALVLSVSSVDGSCDEPCAEPGFVRVVAPLPDEATDLQGELLVRSWLDTRCGPGDALGVEPPPECPARVDRRTILTGDCRTDHAGWTPLDPPTVWPVPPPTDLGDGVRVLRTDDEIRAFFGRFDVEWDVVPVLDDGTALVVASVGGGNYCVLDLLAADLVVSGARVHATIALDDPDETCPETCYVLAGQLLAWRVPATVTEASACVTEHDACDDTGG